MVTVRKKEILDLIVYLQKECHLYFVEFRVTPNNKKALIICNHKNRDWHISIVYEPWYSRYAIVYINKVPEEFGRGPLIRSILKGAYKGYAQKYKYKYLHL